MPIPEIEHFGASASRAVVVEGDCNEVVFGNLEEVLALPKTDMRIFGKPEVKGHRRMAVLLARASSTDEARKITKEMLSKLDIETLK